jgi:DeoR/GlpR family transcriptional regulator of sugar metabolism
MEGKNPMFQLERRKLIIQYLEEHGRASVEELSQKFNVTPMTIRRDLQYFEDNNIAVRTFGGAVLKTNLDTEISYKDKSISHKEEKKRIAEYAATLIKDGQVILLDSGTTNMEIAKKLKDKKGLTIVTPDVLLAGYLIQSTNFKIFCTGGYIQNDIGACIGSKASDFLRDINVDIGFMGASSVDIERGVTTPTIEKAEVKKQIMKSSEKVMLVTDSSKFGRTSFAKICSIDEFELIITDRNLDKKILEELRNLNVSIELV